MLGIGIALALAFVSWCVFLLILASKLNAAREETEESCRIFGQVAAYSKDSKYYQCVDPHDNKQWIPFSW